MGEAIAKRSKTLSVLLREFVIQRAAALGLMDVIVFDRFRQRLEFADQRDRESGEHRKSGTDD